MIQPLYLGRVDYAEALSLQAEIAALVAVGRLANVMLLLEHPPVLTLGRHANRANVLASADLLARRGIALHQTNRGGDVTYHGPGQLVGYPLFDLRTLKGPSGGRMGPVDFVRGMEEALIRVCAGYGVPSGRVQGLTGVWCGRAGNRDQGSGIRKKKRRRNNDFNCHRHFGEAEEARGLEPSAGDRSGRRWRSA
jgi:lipoyl(octanoyl) transferase